MALLIYDNGNLVKNPSSAQFPRHGVAATFATSLAQYSTAQQNSDVKRTLPNLQSSTSTTPSSTTRSTGFSSRLYEETGRKSDSLQDRRKLLALHVMSSPVITAAPFDTIAAAWEKMTNERIDHLVIVNSTNNPLGIITGGDILRRGATSSSFVENLLSDSLIAVSEDTLVREIALIFMEHKVSCVPVVNKEHSVVGIVCRSDLLRLLVSGPNLEQRV